MLRKDGRVGSQMRPIRIIPHYTKNPHGSVLIEYGETRVFCTVSVEDGVPGFLRNQGQGWLTAEYSMLPGSTSQRVKRERNFTSGRSQEIQRLIGRSLRGVINLGACPEFSFLVDCEVIQADAGTRTASVTGSYVALSLAVQKLLRMGRLKTNPLKEAVAAVSIGIKNQELLVDLNFDEDSQIDLDMNVVMTQSGQFLEIQGTAERSSFTQDQVLDIMKAAREALEPIFELQIQASEGLEALS